jgi:proteasome lid subunit RPN8/RPN11
MKWTRIPGLASVLHREIYDHCFGTRDREVGGVLVGMTQPDGPPLVEASIPALRAVESAAQMTFTQDAWEHIHRVLEQHHGDREIVGWYHTHPGYGLFLSEQDRFIHRNFFQNPSQIAVVVDPVAQEEAVFAWFGDEIHEFGRRPCRYQAGNAITVNAPTTPPRSGPGSQAPSKPAEIVPQPAPADGVRDPIAQVARVPQAITLAEMQHDPRLATAIYLLVIGMSAGIVCWALFLR